MSDFWRGWMLRWVRRPWTALSETVLFKALRRRVAGFTVSTGWLGRSWFCLLSPPRPLPEVSERARAYLAAHRRHLEGGQEPPPLPEGVDRDAFLAELEGAFEEERRGRLARGGLGLAAVVPLLARGVRLVARIEEAGTDLFHVLIAEPPESGPTS